MRPAQVIRAPSLVPYAAERAAEENNNSVYDKSSRESTPAWVYSPVSS